MAPSPHFSTEARHTPVETFEFPLEPSELPREASDFLTGVSEVHAEAPAAAPAASTVADTVMRTATDESPFEDAPTPPIAALTPPEDTAPLAMTLASPVSSNGHRHVSGQPRRRRGRDRRRLSMSAVAELCGRLARAADGGDVTALLADVSNLVDAVGASIWLWDSDACALRPSLAHGYSAEVLNSLPAVRADDPNAIAAAFRSGRPCLVDSDGGGTGAIVAPSVGPCGCVGVLALEVRRGHEHDESVRAFAMILAAQLGALLPSQPAG
jgi:hypothetical protein